MITRYTSYYHPKVSYVGWLVCFRTKEKREKGERRNEKRENQKAFKLCSPLTWAGHAGTRWRFRCLFGEAV